MKTNLALHRLMLVPCLCIFLMAALGACGGKDAEKSAESTSEETSEETSSETDEAEDREPASEADQADEESNSSSERATGDMIPYKTLQKYLPKSIKGYQAENAPNGQQMNSPVGSFSQAQQTFRKGDQEITVVISDYQMAQTQIDAASASFNMQYEDDESKVSSVKLKGGKVPGMLVQNKQVKDASLTLIVNNRFMINLNASNQPDTKLVMEVAESLDLDGLAKLK
ncbi:MAG: hypothetical protein HC913_11180 [Microscillaceae bacterium]|nr:hypothetical protein [Microscillaceae bacterium]